MLTYTKDMAKLTDRELTELISEIKYFLNLKKVTLIKLAQMLNIEFGVKESQENLSRKINTGTLRYNEAKRIAKVLGFKINWEEI